MRYKYWLGFIDLIWVVENFARTISLLKIPGPRCCSPHRVRTLRTIFSNPPGVVEMAEAVVAVAQNKGAKLSASHLEWMLIDLLVSGYTPSSVPVLLTQ